MAGVTGLANEVVGPSTQPETPSILWDVGMDMGAIEEPPVQEAPPAPPTAVVDADMFFWAGLANECVGVRELPAPITQNESVAVVAGDANEATRHDSPNTIGPSPNGLQVSDGSYTDSTAEDIGPLTQPSRNSMKWIVQSRYDKTTLINKQLCKSMQKLMRLKGW